MQAEAQHIIGMTLRLTPRLVAGTYAEYVCGHVFVFASSSEVSI